MAKPNLAELLASKFAITPDELHESRALPLSRPSIYEAIKRGEIPSFRLGRKIVIPSAALRAKFCI